MATGTYPPLQERRAPTLFQRKGGNGAGQWRVRYRHAGEVCTVPLGLATAVTEGTPPKEVRTRFDRVFVLPYLQGTFSPWERGEPERANGATVDDAARGFLARHDDSPRTRRAYESVLRLFGETLEPHAALRDVGPDDVRAFVYRAVGERGRPLSRSTRHHDWRHLRAFFRWVAREGLLDASPVDRVDAPRVDERQEPLAEPAQLGALLASARALAPGLRTAAARAAARSSAHAFAFSLGTGLRRDELRFAQVGDVRVGEGGGLVTVRAKTVGRDGVDFRPKGRRDRRVPLNPIAREAAAAAVVDGAGDPRPARAPLFPGPDGAFLTEDRLTKALARAKEGVEDAALLLPGAFDLHALRGQYITYMLLLGWPLPVVQAFAGHRDAQTTLRYWRDAAAVLHGAARDAFLQAAVELGFEPYAGLRWEGP